MSEWKECKIGDVATVHGGKRLPKGKMLISLPTNHPYIRITDFNGHKILLDGIQYVDDEIQKSIARYTVDAGDLVISIVGTLGLCAIIPKELDKANLTENCAKIHIKEDDVEKLFLYYQLISTETQDTIVGFNVGSTQPKLPLYNVQNIKLLLPTLPEQRAIAGVLSSLDDKIDLLHRQNKTLEGMAESLWRKMFVDEADPAWEKGKLGDYLKIQGGYAFKSIDFKIIGEIGVIKITNISGGLVDIVNTQFVNKNIIDTLDRKFKIVTGSILIAMTGAEIGKIGIVEKTEKELWLNQRVGIFHEIKEFGNLLGFFALNSEEGQEHILSSATGSAQPNISSTGIEDFEIPIVTDSVLNEFGIAVKPFFDKMCFNLGQIRTLSRLRDTLLPKLISGEVRVKS